MKTQKQWDKFRDQMQAKLELGEKCYGDASFSKTPEVLILELQQECLDLAGWGFILHSRLQAARDALSGGISGPPKPEKKYGVFWRSSGDRPENRSGEIHTRGAYSLQEAELLASAAQERNGMPYYIRELCDGE